MLVGVHTSFGRGSRDPLSDAVATARTWKGGRAGAAGEGAAGVAEGAWGKKVTVQQVCREGCDSGRVASSAAFSCPVGKSRSRVTVM